MQEYLNKIIPIVSDNRKIIIDLGGGGCPLGFGSIIVDKLTKDLNGNDIKYHDLADFNRTVDVVFACHVFEHIKDLDKVLQQITVVLNDGGSFICMVPSFSNPFWNAGQHNHEIFGPHAWTMGLSKTEKSITAKIPYYIDIDVMVNKYLNVEIAEYCGDDCIFIIASKKGKSN
jgi:SAM-dependent methyltransferase